MSFILDALRKSERDRQSQQGPSVYYPVEAEPPSKAPPWAVAIIVLLALLLVVLAANWFSNRSPDVKVAPASTPVSTAATTTPTPVAARPDRPVRSLSTEADAYAPPPIAPPRADPEFAEAEPAGAATQAATIEPPPREASTAAALSLPSLAEVEAQGLALPDMNLDVHVFSEDAAQRFVFLNGAKYREGDTTRDGPRVIEIVAQGVILDYQSQRFLMPWE